VQRLVILVSRDSAAVKNVQSLVALHSALPIQPARCERALKTFKDHRWRSWEKWKRSISLVTAMGRDTSRAKMRKAPETDDRLGVPHLSDRGRLQPQETQGYDPFCKLPFSTRTAQGPTFAEDFTIALRNCGFSNAVIGFDGLVAVREHGAIGVVPPSKIRKHRCWRMCTSR
jgi:hypothetical protein